MQVERRQKEEVRSVEVPHGWWRASRAVGRMSASRCSRLCTRSLASPDSRSHGGESKSSGEYSTARKTSCKAHTDYRSALVTLIEHAALILRTKAMLRHKKSNHPPGINNNDESRRTEDRA